RNLALAEQLVATGATDVVCIMRGQIADPYLVAKTREGREDEIVRCVGANQCAASRESDMLTCLVNPAAGRERQWGNGTLARAARPSRIAVVGGGPGGIRAARIAGLRGHEVVLFEEDADLGGHLNLLKQLPGRSEWQRAIDDMTHPLTAAGV